MTGCGQTDMFLAPAKDGKGLLGTNLRPDIGGSA